MFRCLFNFYPLFLDENNSTLIRETDRQFFGRLAQESIAAYNIREVCPVSDQLQVQFSCPFLVILFIIFVFIFFSKKQGTSFEFVEVEKANLYRNKGYIYFITFVAKDPCDQTKVFQAKVCNVFCREIEHSFCRLKPGQQGTITISQVCSTHRIKFQRGNLCCVFAREVCFDVSFSFLAVECDEDSKRVVKKPRYNTRSNKRGVSLPMCLR